MDDDGYLGSGIALKKSIQYHGRELHKREILDELESRDLLFKKESEIVNEDLIKDPLCMNRVVGGRGAREEYFSGSWGNDDPDIRR